MSDPSSAPAAPSRQDGIEHVVLLIMENHSFDQMLGALQQTFPDLDGVTPQLASQRFNLTSKGERIYQSATLERQMRFDPHHEHLDVMNQLAGNNGGFVSEFQSAYPGSSAADLQEIMGYYPLDFLPALHRLGREFTVCDRWFASMPGPTWPNRFFALSGTCQGELLMPAGAQLLQPKWYTEQDQATLFSRMTEKSLPWRIYHYDFPCSLVLTQQRQAQNLSHYTAIGQFFEDAAGDAAAFPALTFIEPQYFGVAENDDHPPHNVMKAEKLIADVYNAVRSNPALWEKTLLVVIYDEHGGFYDHVAPPAAVAPDAFTSGWPFNQLGVRVPAVLISPRCARRIEHTAFDHTSLLKYLQDKWQLGPLGERTAHANSIGCAVGAAPLNQLTTPFIRVPNADLISADVESEKDATNANQEGLHHLAEFLYQEADVGMEHLVDLAADAVRVAGVWVRAKHLLGRGFTKLGMWLSADMRAAQARRLERTRGALAHLKAVRLAAVAGRP